MFKLAWTDGLMNMKHSIREAVIVYLMIIIALIGGIFWRDVLPSTLGVFVGVGIQFHPDYGKGRLLPDIFYMVPMSERDKKKYILYRSFGMEWIFSVILGAILFFEMFVLGKNKSLPVFLLLLLWLCMICLKEQFYHIYKQINGKVYYPDMRASGRHIFRTIRVGDYVSGIVSLLCIGTVSSKSGTYSLALYLGPVVTIYWIVSVIHFIRYVQRCINRMELPEML